MPYQFGGQQYIRIVNPELANQLINRAVCIVWLSLTLLTQCHTLQGRRNDFTTGPAKLYHEDYAIKCVGGQQFHEYCNIFLPLILECYNPKMLKSQFILFIT